MENIIIEGILEGIEQETDFNEWVDMVDAEMENADYWDFL